MNQGSVIVLKKFFDRKTVLEYQKRDFPIMLIFKYLQIFFIKMVESGICDDQANQTGIHGRSVTDSLTVVNYFAAYMQLENV